MDEIVRLYISAISIWIWELAIRVIIFPTIDDSKQIFSPYPVLKYYKVKEKTAFSRKRKRDMIRKEKDYKILPSKLFLFETEWIEEKK